MNIQSSIPYTGIWLAIGVAVAIAVSYGVYYFKNDKREFQPFQRILLSALRGLSLFLIMLLLLALLLQFVRVTVEKPILLVGIDNSESMVTGHVAIKDDAIKMVDQLKSELGNKFDVQLAQFGERFLQPASFDFRDKASDYSRFFEKIQEQYFNLNLGAVVLLGDGIANKGINPVLKASGLKSVVYTVGVGDTLIVPDQSITDVVHNNSVFLGNNFPVQVDLNFRNFEADSTRLEILMDNELVVSELIRVVQPNLFLSRNFSVNAGKPGLKTVQVRLAPVENEKNTQNNRFRFVIEVHQEKQKVLMLTQGPHPDLGAISESLKKHANFDVSASSLQNFKGNVNDYELIVLNQLPSLAQQHSAVYDQLKNSGKAVLVIVGPSSSIAALNNLDLNFTLEPSMKFEESIPFFNTGFSLFGMPADLEQVAQVYPPLMTFFTKYDLDKQFSVLAYQRINSINMDFPLIAFGAFEKRKVGVIFGEGIWQWRMREYQYHNSQEVFSSLVTNMVTYLCTNEKKEQFVVRYKTIVDEISPTKIRAQLLDDIFVPVVNAEVSFTLIDSAGSELNYLFDPLEQDYELNLGFLSAGDYLFKAETQLGDQKFIKEGRFSVQPVQLENQETRADFALLNAIAASTGGRFFPMNAVGDLIQELSASQNIAPKYNTEKTINEIIDWKWLLFMLIILLSMEWFLRKFWGSY